MNLAEYQQDIVDQIYHLLVYDDVNRGIALYGDTGSGKSTIAQAVADQLQEGWSVFYMEGIDPSLSPYYTWHIGTRLYSQRKNAFGGEISFGVNFLPTPFSLEFGISPQRNKMNFLLSPNEEALISGIKKQSGANRSILFIADNYEQWDVPSKQLLEKITLHKLALLSDFHVTVLIISHEQVSIPGSFPWTAIPISDISDDNILFVLRQNKYSGPINIKDIRLCANNDLSLALMAAEYYDGEDIPHSTFHEIIDKRYKAMPPEEHKACQVLEPLSIIDSSFTKDETAFFMDPFPADRAEIEYLAEEYLTVAKEQMFITGRGEYHFASGRVREYFKTQLSKREKLYHRKFADYLKRYHPEDYFSRGMHLMFSLQGNDTKIILEAWQLLFLAYIRRASEIGDGADVYHILSSIDALLRQLSPIHGETQRIVFQELRAGWEKFLTYQYKETLFHLQAITASQLVPVCQAEIQRLILLCYIQLAENPMMIKRQAEELYDTITDSNFLEDEQYCRAALVLLDVYIDRSNDSEKAKNLHKGFIQIIQQHPDRLAFKELETCYNRKSSLYYTALVASRQTEQSIWFYRMHHNHIGLYMALCNHSGNTIVSGNYAEAEQAITECTALLNQRHEIYYPCSYKVENNRILLAYLQEESKAGGDRNKLLSAARKALSAFSDILGCQKDEVSHVAFFNYLGLSILCGQPGWQEELSTANIQLAETDEYYQYFLHDLNFACALLQNDLKTAQCQLVKLKSLDVPLLRNYRPIFSKRMCEQELLLNDSERLHGDPFKYHEILSAACSHIQDPSCHFYGRGFLLSDLQFLSF